MTNQTHPVSQTGLNPIPTPPKGNGWLAFFSGLIVGFILLGVLMWFTMPSMMIQVQRSRFDSVEQTCQELKKAIEQAGWSCPGIRDMNQAVAQHGVTLDRPVRIVELCQPHYAKKVLTTNPEVSTLMPCAFGVYKGDDGHVYISKMNTGLMGKMFGGVIAEIMGKYVAKDEEKILGAVVAK